MARVWRKRGSPGAHPGPPFRGDVTRVLACALMVLLAACAGPSRRADEAAVRGGLNPLILRGGKFRLQAYAARGSQPGPLVVILDGDGSPWIDGGRRVAADPTPRVPLALELAIETHAPVLYLGRPCYFDLQRGALCSPVLWTSHRYSREVVDSLVDAADRYAAAHHFRRILLVGYSGGGTLAALMTRTMPRVTGLVTIAGNLDPRAWARWHHYLPLTGSLDPAEEPPPPGLPQWHLIGRRDTNVPIQVVRRYFAAQPSAQVWRYRDFNHVCCWVRIWPSAFERILEQLRVGKQRQSTSLATMSRTL